jgi:hypothetical protein
VVVILADRLVLILGGREMGFRWITQPLAAGMLEQHAKHKV